MTPEIAAVFALLALALASFVWEKLSPDLTAITLFAALIGFGLLDAKDAFGVFSNPAPFTVGAMFIISAALDKCGLIDLMAKELSKLKVMSYGPFLFMIMLIAGVLSAFINNTPIVVIMMPIVLSLAKKNGITGSKVLIPLSYASIMGGTCTLLGTSTNILVDGIAQKAGLAPMRMFEFAWVGLPIFAIGLIYLALFGKKLLPKRETLTSILSEEERREYFLEAFIKPDSKFVGKSLKDAGLYKISGARVVDISRGGFALQTRFDQIVLEAGDRLTLACRATGIAKARALEGIEFLTENKMGEEHIAAHEGMLVEAILGPHSSVIGKTLAEVNFRQHFHMVVMAVHRKGRNLRDQISSMRLEFGDTLLLLGTNDAIQNLRGSEDLILFQESAIRSKASKLKSSIVLGCIAAVVVAAGSGMVPIEVAAMLACTILFLTKCILPKEGYNSIEWNLLFIIYGMLGMGMAMQTTGASAWLANNMTSGVTAFVPLEMQPYVMLACVYLLTNVLTEVLSNNAAAVLMATLAIGIAETLQVDPRAFMFTVAIAASCSFATPIGYQTNTYVYGAGGYRFADFTKVGLPLNVLCLTLTSLIAPRVWPF